MRLAEQVIENERLNKTKKNEQLVRLKLKELVHAYPDEISQVLIKTGIGLKVDLPALVLFAIVVKNIHKNAELREAVAKMLIEMDGFHRADGQWAGIVGGALSAVGSVLTGIGQGQINNSPEQLRFQQEQLALQQRREDEQARRRRNGWMIFGISLVVIAGIILTIRMMNKAKLETKTIATS